MVRAVVRGARAARDRLRGDPTGRPQLRPGLVRPASPADPQPRRAIGFPARARASDLLRGKPARPLGCAPARACSTAPKCSDRFLQSPPALADRFSRPGVPKTTVVHRTRDLAKAAEAFSLSAACQSQRRRLGRRDRPLCFPRRAARLHRTGTVPASVDQILLVQDYVPARGGTIMRIETLGGPLPLRDRGRDRRRQFRPVPR